MEFLQKQLANYNNSTESTDGENTDMSTTNAPEPEDETEEELSEELSIWSLVAEVLYIEHYGLVAYLFYGHFEVAPCCLHTCIPPMHVWMTLLRCVRHSQIGVPSIRSTLHW